MRDKCLEVPEMRSYKDCSLPFACNLIQEVGDSPVRPVERNEHQMGRRNGQHVPQHAIHMVVSKTVAIGDYHCVRTAACSRKVAKKLCVRILERFNVLGRIRIDKELLARSLREFGMVVRSSKGDPAAMDLQAPGRPHLLSPVHRAVKFRQSHHSLKVTWFTTNAGGIIVQVDTQPKRSKHGQEVPYEAIQHAQPKQIAPEFDQTVVVGRENMQALSSRGAARKWEEKTT